MSHRHMLPRIGVRWCRCFEPRSNKSIYYACAGFRTVCTVGVKFILVRAERPYFQSSAARVIGTIDDQSS
jgi:hypothetical protein